jgi:hypothetical protein
MQAGGPDRRIEAEDRTTTDKAMIRFSGANTRDAHLAWDANST